MGWLPMVALVAAIVGLVALSTLWPQVVTDELLGLMFLLLIFALYWVFFAICIKRVRDLGSSGWTVLLVLVPLMGPLFPILWE